MNGEQKRTLVACYLGLLTQAVMINLPPLLFVIFNTQLSIPLSVIALFPTAIFALQMVMDIIFPHVITKIGYKNAAIISAITCIAGLTLLSTANFFANATIFIFLSTFLCAIGSAFLEVISSPLVEALPTTEKKGSMNLLHSFYCFGHLFVIILTTVFFALFGKQYWYILPLIGILSPLSSLILFLTIKNVKTLEDNGRTNNFKSFGKNITFVLFFMLMVCAGACEQAIAQWASYFAEIGLNITKATGDLLGAGLFALLMALSRMFYGIFAKGISNVKSLIICSIGLLISYAITSLSPLPILSLIGIALCGLFVGITWPTTLSLASSSSLNGGTLMFALLALGGDIGCTLGPTLVGQLSSGLGVSGAILVAEIFPALFLCLLIAYVILSRKKSAKQHL